MREGCTLYDVTAMNKKDDTVNIEQYLVLLEFLYVFLEELLGLPPKRKMEFTIELKSGTKHITKSPYCMPTPWL